MRNVSIICGVVGLVILLFLCCLSTNFRVGFRITGDRERREVQRHEGASDITRDREVQPCDVKVSGGKIGDKEVRPRRGSGETGDRKKAKVVCFFT